MNMPVSVAWRDRPFDGDFHRHLVPFAGRPPTIADAIRAVPGLPDVFLRVGVVRLNGEVVPREWWGRVRPRSTTDSTITLHMPLHDKGGSQSGAPKKNPLATVATIAVLLAAAAVSGGVLGTPALLGASFAGGTWGAAVLGASVGIGGALAVAALFKPPSLAQNNQQQTAPSSVQDQAASLSGNVISPGSAVPRVLGTMRVFPPFVTPQLIELRAGGVEYAETVLGLAGPHALQQIWVDGVDITSIPEANIEIQEGLSQASVQSLVTRQGFTVSPNLTLSEHLLDPNQSASEIYLDPSRSIALTLPQPHKFVTRNAPDELWIHFSYPGGLVNQAGGSVAMPFRIQIRPAGSSTWTNLPELHYQRKPESALSGFKTEVRFKWQKAPVQTVSSVWDGGTGWIFAYSTVPGQTLETPVTAGYSSDPYFYSGSGNTYLSSASLPGASGVINVDLTPDNAIVYLDPAIFVPGQYEIQITRGCAYTQSKFTQSSYNYNNGIALTVWDFFQYFFRSSASKNAIPVDRVNFSSTCQVERIVSVWNQNPIQSSDFATISMVVYSRQLSNISVLASGYVADWDGTAWRNITTTSNPAAHFRDVLGGVLGIISLPSAVIDDVGLVAWRAACASLGYECNAVVEGKTYVDALNLLASCGYGRPRMSETWGIIRDYDRSGEAPVQIFTPRNSDSFTWTKSFVPIPTGVRVSYFDADLDYTPNNLIVYADPANEDNSNLETMTYDGLVTEAEVRARATYDLVQAADRFTFYSLNAAMDSIVCQRGDVVGVQSDILDSRAGYARIAEVVTSNGLVTGLILEGSVPTSTDPGIFSTAHVFALASVFNTGTKVGVAIRLKNGAGVLTKQVSAAVDGETNVVSFVVPFTDPGPNYLDADCLCSFGPLGSEYRRLIVDGITPKPDMTATISMVDEALRAWSPLLGTTSGDVISSDDGTRLFSPFDQASVGAGVGPSVSTDSGVDIVTESGDLILTTGN